jgi:hypothetical protein
LFGVSAQDIELGVYLASHVLAEEPPHSDGLRGDLGVLLEQFLQIEAERVKRNVEAFDLAPEARCRRERHVVSLRLESDGEREERLNVAARSIGR